MGKRWTRQDDRTLISLLYKETSTEEIAILLRRTIQAVENRAWSLGYSKKKMFTEKLGERTRKYREQELALLRPRRPTNGGNAGIHPEKLPGSTDSS